mmetsp:Transcript_3934/g.15179  ORF Transcript_3934/g.15179 Transcript_3934/m.15179 type:complete len:204 (-) Transcript_3934:1169-1780(-)
MTATTTPDDAMEDARPSRELGARVAELRASFESALRACAEPPTAQEFIRAFPGLNPAHHAALYDAYAEVLRSVERHAEEEFEAICEEESVEARLNAIDALCAERGVMDLDVASNAARVAYSGKSPDEVARNTRAEAKRKEAETLREEAAALEMAAQETIAALEAKREAVRAAATGLKTGTQGGDVVQDASTRWAARAPQPLKS